jgi:hypothetical protein
VHRLSSQMTFFYKWIFPAVWFGFIALFLAIPLTRALLRTLSGGSVSGESFAFLLPPVLMAIVGYFIMKKLTFDLVDEVLDAGDALVIRNRGTEERVPLADIINVNYTQATSPPRVTLSLRNPGQFGDQVTFCAPLRLSPFAVFSPSPVIDDLINRIDAARRRSAR